jgi:hypothetical protein
MNVKLKKIISLVLLLVLLLPSIVKLEHNHNHIGLKAINENDNRSLHNKCLICNFEFSIFIPNIEETYLQNENAIDSYSDKYISGYYSDFSQFSFLLRAPPGIEI